MPGLTPEELRAGIAAGEIDTVVVGFPDLQGRIVGKRVTGEHYLEHVAAHGIEACDYLLAVDLDMEPLPGFAFANWDLGYGDLVVQADLATCSRLPWLPGTALVLGDVFGSDGTPVAVAPRAILLRQVERAREMGLVVDCATELECYVFKDHPDDAAARGWAGLTPHSRTIQDYQVLLGNDQEPFLRQVRRDLIAAGVPVESTKGEAGRGQQELNLAYGEPLAVADRHVLAKEAVKEIARQHGLSVTFMAKWSMAQAGSSCHLHTSLRDAQSGRPLVADEHDPRGLSPTGRHWLAGQLAGARELALCFAPTVNAYKRYVPDSWAPTAIVWGEDNRTCGFRVVGHGPSRRVESRIPGADVNPYIALAAAIASGLAGIEAQMDPGPAYTGNGYSATDVPRIPPTLPEAISAFEGSQLARAAFGSEVHDHLANLARQEWAAANRAVTDWELARYFERA